jgi:hypothetical protein
MFEVKDAVPRTAVKLFVLHWCYISLILQGGGLKGAETSG